MNKPIDVTSGGRDVRAVIAPEMLAQLDSFTGGSEGLELRASNARMLVGAGLAGASGAVAAVLLGGVFGRFDVGLAFAGAFMLATMVAIGVLLHRSERLEGLDIALVSALLEGATDGRVLTDATGEVLWANTCYLRQFGQPAEALDVLFGDEPESADVFRRIKADLQSHGVSEGTLRRKRNDRDCWYQVTVRTSGQLVLWRVHQLTPETLFSEFLNDLESTHAVPLTMVGVGLLAVDDAGRVRYLNEAAARFLDRPAGLQEAPAPLDDLVDPDGHIVHGKDGDEAAVMASQPVSGPVSSLLIGRLVFLKLPEEPATAGGQRLGELTSGVLFDMAPVALGAIDKDGVMTRFNPAFTSFAPNKTLSEGASLCSLVAEEDRQACQELLDRTFATSRAQASIDLKFNTQPERTGQMHVFPFGSGDEAMALVFLIDTTQQKSLEKQFVQAQKMQAVGQLAGGVAHDFNNLLTAIIGFCDLLLVRHGPGDQSFTDIMQIKQNANRAANLVRQLLAFSRQQTMRPKVLMITDVLAEISNLLRRLIGETLELEVVHGRNLGPIKVDQGQLEQVIINLAVNARDAMAGSGKLTIRTSMIGPDDVVAAKYDVMKPGNYVLLEVVDTGCGIPEDNLNKIFEPFFTTKEVGKGTGLGLATVYGIIKQTGGFVFAESTVGQGTTFRIYLPEHAQQEEAEDGDAPEAHTGPRDLTGKETILLVEDEDAVRMFASRALTNKGYKVLEADNGLQGLDYVQTYEGDIDLIISDVVMPSMDGPTLVREARKTRPNMRVIFISGYAEDSLRRDLGSEDYAFLPKPFALKQLAERVKEVLA